MNKKLIGCALAIFAALGAGNAQATTYTVGGAVTGLASGKSIVIRNNSSSLLVTTNSGFTFPAQNAGTSYSVSVGIQPSGQTCRVTNGTGSNISANITNVSIDCQSAYSISGTINGLVGRLVLRMGSSSLLVASGATSFKFSTNLITGSAYAVTVGIQPAGYKCTVSNGAGIITNTNINNVSISCLAAYQVGGTVSGLQDTSLVMKLNNSASLLVAAGATTFKFSSCLVDGSSYQVTIPNQPQGYTCLINNASGVISGATVNNVAVLCSQNDPPMIWDTGHWDDSTWN